MRCFALALGAALVVCAARGQEEATTTTAAKEQEELELEVMRDTIAAGRGERDAPGIRDQWESGSGIGGKDDVRAPISRKVRAMMRDNGLRCEGCSHREAVALVNDFIKSEQERLAAEERREKVLGVVVPMALTVVAAVVVAASVFLGLAIGDSGGADRAMTEEIRDEIKKTQTYAEAMAAAKGEAPAKAQPTWREIEEREAWTPRQEKQFAKALGPLLGLAPKERWPLVADKVDGKDKKECASHYKLLQILEREARQQADADAAAATAPDDAPAGSARRRTLDL